MDFLLIQIKRSTSLDTRTC